MQDTFLSGAALRFWIQILLLPGLLLGTPAGAVGKNLTDDVARLFKPGVFHFTGGRYRDEPFYYRLHVPPTLEPGRRYPLVIWLHGYGDYEYDEFNAGQLIHSDNVLLQDGKPRSDRDFFIVAMQLPRSRPSWFDHRSRKRDGAGDEPGEIVMRLVDSVIEQQPIDELAISAVGISGGGSSCWELAARHGSRLSAIAPIAGGGSNPQDALLIANTAVWALHMDGDPITPIATVRRMVDAVNAAGGEAALTELHGRDHNAWDEALGRYDVVRWLVQRRGTSGPAPGQQNSIMTCGIYVIVGLAICAVAVCALRAAGLPGKLTECRGQSRDDIVFRQEQIAGPEADAAG
jgi:predicted esterase